MPAFQELAGSPRCPHSRKRPRRSPSAIFTSLGTIGSSSSNDAARAIHVGRHEGGRARQPGSAFPAIRRCGSWRSRSPRSTINRPTAMPMLTDLSTGMNTLRRRCAGPRRIRAGRHRQRSRASRRIRPARFSALGARCGNRYAHDPRSLLEMVGRPEHDPGRRSADRRPRADRDAPAHLEQRRPAVRTTRSATPAAR